MFNLHSVLLTLHVLVAIVTIGWLMMDAMVMPRAIRTGNVAALKFANSVAEKVGPAAGLVLVFGIWLVLRDAHDGIDFSTKWVGLGMALFILAMVNGAVFIAGAARRAVGKLEAGQDALAEAKRISMLGGLNAILLTVIVYLMVARPA